MYEKLMQKGARFTQGPGTRVFLEKELIEEKIGYDGSGTRTTTHVLSPAVNLDPATSLYKPEDFNGSRIEGEYVQIGCFNESYNKVEVEFDDEAFSNDYVTSNFYEEKNNPVLDRPIKFISDFATYNVCCNTPWFCICLPVIFANDCCENLCCAFPGVICGCQRLVFVKRRYLYYWMHGTSSGSMGGALGSVRLNGRAKYVASCGLCSCCCPSRKAAMKEKIVGAKNDGAPQIVNMER